MRAKRVVLLRNRSVLTAGVQRLLQNVSDLHLSVITADDPEAVRKLKELAPQVIVLDSGDTSLGEEAIAQLLGEHPKAKVIALNAGRTGIEVYRMRRVLETDLDGLLKAIHGRGPASGRRHYEHEEGVVKEVER